VVDFAAVDADSALGRIKQFFDEYTAAFDMAEGERIAACYHVPCMTLRMDGSLHVFQDRREIREFFDGVARKYRDEGMRTYRLAVYEPRMLGALAAVVTVKWEGLRAGHHSVVRSWWQTYNLRCADGKWLIVLNTNHIPDSRAHTA
jgi:hypothetical protein